MSVPSNQYTVLACSSSDPRLWNQSMERGEIYEWLSVPYCCTTPYCPKGYEGMQELIQFV